MRTKGFCITLVVTALVLLIRPITAKGESPLERVRLVLERAMDIQTTPELQGEQGRPHRARLIRELISENFLTAKMAQESLGDKWNGLPKEQKEEFRELFVDLFQDSYTRMVLNFLRRETIEYLGVDSVDSRMLVRTKIVRVNEHIPVYYTLEKNADRWFMVDVIIDGVSIVKNYQNKFRQVISSRSFEHLLDQMKLQAQATREAK